jgi:thioredoxin reductase
MGQTDGSMLRQSTEILVVGGGPAGMSAAVQASALGLSVVLVDERPSLGGQIYKQPGPGFRVRDSRGLSREQSRGRALAAALETERVTVLSNSVAVEIEDREVVVVRNGGTSSTIVADRIILAPGAADRPVAFPGWTLPGVITAGGVQTLIKTQRVLPGERIAFAGSGPVALAFPAQLSAYGANLVLLCDAGRAPSFPDLVRLTATARHNSDLLRDAVRYRAELLRARVPIHRRRVVLAARGVQRVQSVVHAEVNDQWQPIAGTEEEVAADTLCIGYGFTASVELFKLAGCEISDDEDRGGPVVVVDEWMRTTAPAVLAAGDGTGVEGAVVAEDEGHLAALGAARELGKVGEQASVTLAAPIRERLHHRRRFRAALEPMHRVGAGVYELATPQTTICRCEEVTAAELSAAIGSTEDIEVVKALTRAGMGLCQGRNCQRQILKMLAAEHGDLSAPLPSATGRWPVRPVRLGAVSDTQVVDDGLFFGDDEQPGQD